MRALRSCDFCDGEAVGTFEALPPELEPTETEQRRIVLCSDCRDQLEDLLEPLLARAGVETRTATAGGDAEPPTDAESTDTMASPSDIETGDSGTVVASANESTQKRGRTSSPNATISGPETGETDETDETDETGRTDGAGETDETDETDADGDSKTDPTLEGGITFERADTSSESGDATADGSPSQQSANRPPKAYGKVIRLLQNREFPMPRAAVENLAAGAYDLESHEVEAVVDHALEEGEFVENRDTLERP
ncbi:hypothetical protein [Natronorubrum tibetense]|uniref:Uncharacterized protein n=1 Tax=Natronorubrum tibetense GA33 TaxID=1114856 RepID=L9VH15_9EURY|nr:hypothetical protein [Natronorubrum tibetense]ELY36262.1 hypothetical protein C496_21949 [Natronorubrum tibetense GA33]